MPVQPPSDKCPKAACSVSEMASRCTLSRARFYELIRSGIMPHPCYDLRTRRPLYPAELQERCIRVRTTNTAVDGSYVLFNNRRARAPAPDSPDAKRISSARPILSAAIDPPDLRVSELADGLRSLGVTASDAQIQAAAVTCYPQGLANDGIDVAIRSVFRYLRRSSAA